MARHFEKCKNCPPRSSRDLRIKVKPKNPKILKVILISQLSRYRRKILDSETCTQALADGIAKRRHFQQLTLKLRSRSFSHKSQYLIYLMSYQLPVLQFGKLNERDIL